MLLISPICGEVLVLDFSSEAEKKQDVDVSVYLFIYIKELAYAIMVVWQVQNVQGGSAG